MSSIATIKVILLFVVLSLMTPATALAQKKKQRKTFREKLQIADSLRLQLRQSADRGQMLRWADSLFIDRVLRSNMGEKKKQRLLRQYHKRQARMQRYDRLLFRGDSLLAAKYNKIKYDTAYIARPDARWTVKLTGVLSGADMQTVTKTDALERRTHVMADCRGTFSVAAAYRGLGLSLSVNPAKLAGKNKDYEFNLNSYSNRYGFDVVYLSSKTFHGHRYVDGKRVDVGRGQVSQNALNLNFYYAFNSRRFSFPAAFSQSYVQKRSAGSWMIGASFDGSKTEMKDMTIRLNEFAVGGGYAYNLVVHRHWLFHLSALPTVTYIPMTTPRPGFQPPARNLPPRLMPPSAMALQPPLPPLPLRTSLPMNQQIPLPAHIPIVTVWSIISLQSSSPAVLPWYIPGATSLPEPQRYTTIPLPATMPTCSSTEINGG